MVKMMMVMDMKMTSMQMEHQEGDEELRDCCTGMSLPQDISHKKNEKNTEALIRNKNLKIIVQGAS